MGYEPLAVILSTAALAAELAAPLYLTLRRRYITSTILLFAIFLVGTGVYYSYLVSLQPVGVHEVIVNETNETIVNKTIVYVPTPILDYNATGGAALSFISSVYFAETVALVAIFALNTTLYIVRLLSE